MSLLYCFVNHTKKLYIGCDKLSILPGSDAGHWFCKAIMHDGNWYNDNIEVGLHPCEDGYPYYDYEELKVLKRW